MNVEEIIERKIPVLASFSGGKDSCAMALYLLYESGIPKEQIRLLFADTGWEHHYTYSTVLRMAMHHPIQIVRSKKYDGMVGLMEKRGIPTQLVRYCTQELKVFPLREYQNRYDEYITAKGIRKEEGTYRNGRGEVDEFELDLGTMMYSWYPIRNFTLQDVWDIHAKYRFERNKLYDLGCNRVGCMPCIYASKSILKLTGELLPEHIEEVRKAEQKRNFPFISPIGKAKFHNKVANNGKPYADIDAILKWANMTTKEVRAYNPEDDQDTCSSGLCE